MTRAETFLTALRELRIVRVTCGVCELCGIRYPKALLGLHRTIFGRTPLRDILVVCPICDEQLRHGPVPPALVGEINRARSHCTWVRMRLAGGYTGTTYSPPIATDLAPIFEDVIRGGGNTFRTGG